MVPPEHPVPMALEWTTVWKHVFQVYTSHGPTVIMPSWFMSRDVFYAVGAFDEGGKVCAQMFWLILLSLDIIYFSLILFMIIQFIMMTKLLYVGFLCFFIKTNKDKKTSI